MITNGEKVIVWDPTAEDMYTAVAVEDTTNEFSKNPLVKICGVVKYPMQRAALFADCASETAPIPGGTVCRLRLICKGWLCFESSYPDSLDAARDLMIEDALSRINQEGRATGGISSIAAKNELEILLRHRKGEYAPRTVMGRDRPLIIRWSMPEQCAATTI